MRISRSRWYKFFRRVFHYQNGSGSGSGSDLGPNPFDSKNWMMMELIALVVQISVTVYTLIISQGERPVWPMRLWVSGYAFGCFLSLVLLYFRYRLVHITQQHNMGSSGSDVEQQINHEESRILQYAQKCKTSLELLFAIWFVMGNVWVFDSRFGSYRRAPKLHVLCISLLAWNAMSYSFPFILFVLLCCCVPLLSSLLGYNMNTASLQRGATDQQLASLPSWKYNGVNDDDDVELGDSAKNQQVPECCICLAKYRDKEEIRQLPCTHIFHLNCVDQWLKIISCCPLCKQGIE
ncbi:E3 ubiquitin-protein ligase at4g11680 [Phtheirospermum japonicum]|uniref:E3 ubiquitin-protein ligase at4g11680 n=1 Tax=Phtheirospermum japonicum TaxID=374723 RepID=A0A830BQJ3_9LAMI|nr:E3 ubiquitin-protein ligase at4g11680 [Phtheirospermum japonicum]